MVFKRKIRKYSLLYKENKQNGPLHMSQSCVHFAKIMEKFIIRAFAIAIEQWYLTEGRHDRPDLLIAIMRCVITIQ